MGVAQPAAGPPWDLPAREAPYAFVDLEMTGLDPVHDRIVEVCIHRTTGEQLVESFSSLVNPGERGAGASHIHGIDASMLAGAGGFDSVVGDIARLLEGAIFVAHGAQWDVRFLLAEARRYGKTLEIPHFIDTLNLARRAFSFSSYALPSLCTSLGIPHPNAHRAEPDVLALREVFAKCLVNLSPTTPRDLFQVRIGERVARDAILEAATGAVQAALPVLVTFRPSGRAARTCAMVLTEVERDADPPLVRGYEVESRSRRQLRADRIVAIAPYDVSSGKDPG